MRLEGIHHVTCITGDVLRNVDFYTRVLGLRLVGKSVNQDDPYVYHVFYSNEKAAPRREGDRLYFADPEGLAHELVIPTHADPPLTADHPEIPRALGLQGFEGVRAFSRQPERSRPLLEGVLSATAMG